MGWSAVARKLRKAAPSVAGALVGPGGALVGQAIAKRLGVDPDPDVVAAALENEPGGPEQIAQEFDPVALAAVQAADRKHARLAGPLTWHQPRAILAAAAVLMLGMVAGLSFWLIADEGEGSATDAELLLLGTVVGYIAGMAERAFNFLYGTTT